MSRDKLRGYSFDVGKEAARSQEMSLRKITIAFSPNDLNEILVRKILRGAWRMYNDCSIEHARVTSIYIYMYKYIKERFISASNVTSAS